MFLSEYVLDLKSGNWTHKFHSKPFNIVENFGAEESLKYISGNNINHKEEVLSHENEHKKYFTEAKNIAHQIKEKDLNSKSLNKEIYPSWFYYINFTSQP